MKTLKITATTLCAAMMLTGCGAGNENAASGGILGAQLGSILGSAIGGISGGPRGSDIGTIVGMAGGAAVGVAMGTAADNARRADVEKSSQSQRRRQYNDAQQTDTYAYGTSRNSSDISQDNADSGFDPNNGGDDIISFDAPAADGSTSNAQTISGDLGSIDSQSMNYSAPSAPSQSASFSAPALEIRSVRFADKDNDLTLRRGEMAKVVLEVYNNSSEPLYNVQPVVEETTGNKHIFVSAPILVEKIGAGKGIRYTAMVKADSKLKDGKAHFRVTVREAAHRRSSEQREFDIATKRE